MKIMPLDFFLRNLLKICENFLETSHRVLRISLKISYPYMCILPSVYTHIQKPKCTCAEGRMRIYERELPYMRILALVNAHIRNPKCTYTEALFCICAFCLPYMHIHGRQNAHIQKRDSVYVCSLLYM